MISIAQAPLTSAVKSLFLLRRQYGILHRFSDAEFQRCFGRDLDRFARRRITSFASFTLRQDDFTEARKYELTVLLYFLACESRKLSEDLFRLCFLKTKLLGEMVDYFGLAHALAVGLTCCHLGVTASKKVNEVKLTRYHIPVKSQLYNYKCTNYLLFSPFFDWSQTFEPVSALFRVDTVYSPVLICPFRADRFVH
jgi:hypothetical protein